MAGDQNCQAIGNNWRASAELHSSPDDTPEHGSGWGALGSKFGKKMAP
jgi:hypothetical protein